MSLKINKKFKNLPISLKILGAFLSVCCGLTAISGIVYYSYASKVVKDSIKSQAFLVCDHADHEFNMRYSGHIERELRLLVTSPQLNNYLMSSKEETPIYRAEVERLFLSLLQESEIYLSTTFLDASGHERIAVYGNKRKRIFRPLAEIAEDGLLGQNMKKLFMDLKLDRTKTLAYTAPFYDAQNKLGILVGIAKQEPEAGGFGGVIVQHCDLTNFIHDVSQNKVLNTAVMWVYGSDWKNLLSPPDSEVQQDPKPYLTRGRKLANSQIYTAKCRLFANEGLVITVVCSIPPKIVSKQLIPVLWSVTAIFSALLVISLISSFLISRWISGPIKKLTKATENVSVEKLDVDLDPKLTESRDEIGVLASAFEKMLSNLKESTDNLNLEITERKKAEEVLRKSEEFTRRVIESSNDCIKVLDLEGHLLSMSRGGQKLLDIDDVTPYLNSSFIDFWKGKEREGALEAVSKAKQGDTGIFYGYFETAKGTPKWWEIIVSPIKDADDSIDRLLAVSRDVTERKKAEQRQAQLLEQLEKTNQELKDFAYIVSHDLKAPLRGIKTLTEWITTDYADKLDDNGKEQMNLLAGRVDRMHNLIDGILQYSRAGRVEEEKVVVNLNELVTEAIDMIAPPENITITVENELPTIECEQTRIMQVFQNLLSNAVKYMDKPQGQIKVGCVEENGFWEFSVADNGPGIEEKYFEKIFQLFQPLAPRDESESTGIGLTIIKKIVEMYGGKTWVQSKVGSGSTFFFTLPKTLSVTNNKKQLLTSSC